MLVLFLGPDASLLVKDSALLESFIAKKKNLKYIQIAQVFLLLYNYNTPKIRFFIY